MDSHRFPLSLLPSLLVKRPRCLISSATFPWDRDVEAVWLVLAIHRGVVAGVLVWISELSLNTLALSSRLSTAKRLLRPVGLLVVCVTSIHEDGGRVEKITGLIG